MATTVTDELWPPRSARQALLSSPSGRKKYADVRTRSSLSPSKQSPNTPSLLDRMRLARRNEDHFAQEEEGDDDDEETLQLKLAAIEAKLKLKKLQNRAKREDRPGIRPTSAGNSIASRIEVELSPVKRAAPDIEPRSPSRILLGIDKGVRGADISLRRAKASTGSPLKQKTRYTSSSSNHQNSNVPSTQVSRRQQSTSEPDTKSFSERMADVRDNDRQRDHKLEDTQRARSKKFKLDATEMQMFKAAAAESKLPARSLSPVEEHLDDIDPAPSAQRHGLRKVKTLPDLRNTRTDDQGDATMFEGFSGLHLSSRILPHSFLKRTLQSDEYTIWKIPDLLKNVTSPAYEIPDNVGNFVIFGVIASKSSPLDQKNRAVAQTKTSNDWEKKWEDGSLNRKKFMALTLTDLKWSIDLFLFDTALPRYHRLTPGTVIAVLNPSIMPPKRGREDTGAFSLAVHDGDDTILEIGNSKHLGYCNVVKRDGKECGQWVNVIKSEICEWHLNAQVAKTQAKRMGVNAGTNGFGGDSSRKGMNGSNSRDNGQSGGYGLLPAKRTQGFDRESGSHFYMTSSNAGSRATPRFNSEISTARMLDLDDDPFIAEGQFERDKGARLQKRMVNEERERQIAARLANLGSGSSAGSNYMRRRAENDISLDPTKDDLRHRRDHIMGLSTPHADDDDATHNLRAEMGKKRAAEDVKLGPTKKKTRFVTDRGIKEAGKESVGVSARDSRPRYNFDNDDDDELDIV